MQARKLWFQACASCFVLYSWIVPKVAGGSRFKWPTGRWVRRYNTGQKITGELIVAGDDMTEFMHQWSAKERKGHTGMSAQGHSKRCPRAASCRGPSANAWPSVTSPSRRCGASTTCRSAKGGPSNDSPHRLSRHWHHGRADGCQPDQGRL